MTNFISKFGNLSKQIRNSGSTTSSLGLLVQQIKRSSLGHSNPIKSFTTSITQRRKKTTKFEYEYEMLPVNTDNRIKFSTIFFLFVVSGLGAPFAILHLSLKKMGPSRELAEDEY
uniref:Cytochrome c oxidase polypeptide VIIc n=1 Tax=Cacopsylla melanoneura TaxID=428564 RepID=A0A8D9BBG1_9HEMI